MKFVLDSNVAAKWFLPEPDSALAVALREGIHSGVHAVVAPDIYPIEVAHALTKAQRRGRITAAELGRHMGDLLQSLPRLVPHLPLLPRAVALASGARIGVYDCLYVALAEREGCSLVTADERLTRALPGSPVVLLADVP